LAERKLQLVEKRIQHLLMIDLPSVDKENDEGKIIGSQSLLNVKM
jgi:hypothetical protein